MIYFVLAQRCCAIVCVCVCGCVCTCILCLLVSSGRQTGVQSKSLGSFLRVHLPTCLPARYTQNSGSTPIFTLTNVFGDPHLNYPGRFHSFTPKNYTLNTYWHPAECTTQLLVKFLYQELLCVWGRGRGKSATACIFFSINPFNRIVFKGQGLKLSSTTVFPSYQGWGQHLFSTTLTH